MNLFYKGLARGRVPFIIVLCLSLWNYFQESNHTIKALLFYAVIFLILRVFSVIYEIKSWSYLKQMVVHYLIMLLTIFPFLLVSGYYPVHSFKDLVGVFITFTTVGIVLFAISSLVAMFRRRKH